MINDLQDLSTLNTGHRLSPLIVVHQDHLLPFHAQQISSGNHPLIMAVLIQDREIPMALAGHNIFDIIRIILNIKADNIFRFHKIPDGHTLIDQSGSRKGIKGRGDHRTLMLLCQLLDGHGYRRSVADHDTACIHFDGTELGFIPVPQDHQIVFLNVGFHQIRIGCRHQYLSLIKIRVLVTDDHNSFQRLLDVDILGAGRRQNRTVIHIHIGIGNVTNGDQAFQMIVPGNGQSDHSQLLHQRPGLL